MTNGYFPTCNFAGIFEDNLDEYKKHIFAHGVVCGCTGKTYNKRSGFLAHCKTKKHQKWLVNLALEANHYRAPVKKSTYNSLIKCIICTESLNNESIALPCAHTFHTKCIYRWLKIKKECPICKTSV